MHVPPRIEALLRVYPRHLSRAFESRAHGANAPQGLVVARAGWTKGAGAAAAVTHTALQEPASGVVERLEMVDE